MVDRRVMISPVKRRRSWLCGVAAPAGDERRLGAFIPSAYLVSMSANPTMRLGKNDEGHPAFSLHRLDPT